MKINLLFQIWTILAQSIDNSIIDFAHENLLAIISLLLAILLSIYYDKTWFSSLIFLRFSPIWFFSQNTMYYFMFLIFIFWFDSFLSYDSILFLYFIINVKKKKTLHRYNIEKKKPLNKISWRVKFNISSHSFSLVNLSLSKQFPFFFFLNYIIAASFDMFHIYC